MVGGDGPQRVTRSESAVITLTRNNAAQQFVIIMRALARR
jgi:hypothetical protein